MSRLKVYLVVLAAYAALTCFFTYPLVLHVGSALPGLEPDTYLYIWNLEWVRRAIFEFGTNPFFTSEIYYPTGISLYFHTLILGSDFLALPFQFAFGSVTAYMVALLGWFVLTGLGAYLLAYDVTKNYGAAFFAGLVFTFSPYHLAHLNYAHFNLIALQWLPFFILAAKKYFERPSWQRLAMAVIFMVWVSLTDWYYALYAALFFGLYTLYWIVRAMWTQRNVRAGLAPLGRALLILVLYTIVLSPIFYGMIGDFGGGGVDEARAMREADRFSADLLGFITPTTLSPLWGNFITPLAASLHGGLAERSIFYGYVPLALAVWAVLRRRRQTLFWVIVVLVFSILALGPVLHIAGETKFGPDQFQILLPSALFFKLPVISGIFSVARSISRYSVIALLAVALMAAMGLTELSKRVSPRNATFLVAGACLLVGLEFFPTPMPFTPLHVPQIIEDWRADPTRFGVLDLPLDFDQGGRAMYFWTVDAKPRVNGYHSQLPPFPMVDGVPSLRQMVRGQGADIILKPKIKPASALQFFDIRYVVLHTNESAKAVDPVRNRIQATWRPSVLSWKDDEIEVYTVPEAKAPPLMVMLDASHSLATKIGWVDPELWTGGQIWRWMRNDANLFLYARQPQKVQLTMQTTAFAKPRELQITLNDHPVYARTISNQQVDTLQLAVDLAQGENILKFHSVEPPEQPAALGLGDDARFLSIAFSQFTLEPERKAQ